MIKGWTTDDEQLKKLMKVPIKKKFEWLENMRRFVLKISSKKLMKIRWKLRENPSRDGKWETT